MLANVFKTKVTVKPVPGFSQVSYTAPQPVVRFSSLSTAVRSSDAPAAPNHFERTYPTAKLLPGEFTRKDHITFLPGSQAQGSLAARTVFVNAGALNTVRYNVETLSLYMSQHKGQLPPGFKDHMIRVDKRHGTERSEPMSGEPFSQLVGDRFCPIKED